MVVKAPLCHLQHCNCKASISASVAVGKLLPSKLHKGVLAMDYIASKPKSVFVRAYVRFRLGRLENVCQHFRSYPSQLTFAFN